MKGQLEIMKNNIKEKETANINKPIKNALEIFSGAFLNKYFG